MTRSVPLLDGAVGAVLGGPAVLLSSRGAGGT